ncbi:hypothetical protein J6590_014288 [Homalodisca vitripennis]|nr:hypothetical protein J6590_014288 [Homalodisca vitripennis]
MAGSKRVKDQPSDLSPAAYYAKGTSHKTKTNEEVASEGRILREMLEIVERRDSLINQLEEDRQRCGRSWCPPLSLPPTHNTTPLLHPLLLAGVAVVVWSLAHYITTTLSD